MQDQESGRDMFGGKWMDTFMDKLAQKLTAQEMIKANAAADAAELSRMREQAAEYESLFNRMQGSSELSAENAKKVQENVQKVQELVDAAIARIEEMQTETEGTEEIRRLLEELKEQQAASKKTQTEQLEQLTEHVHKENVKVYRNVQAVVVDETAKQNETNGKRFSSASRRLTAVLILSIMALLTSAAGLVFQILVYLHII